MLTLTPRARDVVRQIRTQPFMSDEAGLRLAHQGPAASISVGAVERPRTGDKVLDYEGARVFLDQRAVGTLSEKQLDVGTDDQGRLQFVVTAPDSTSDPSPGASTG